MVASGSQLWPTWCLGGSHALLFGAVLLEQHRRADVPLRAPRRPLQAAVAAVLVPLFTVLQENLLNKDQVGLFPMHMKQLAVAELTVGAVINHTSHDSHRQATRLEYQTVFASTARVPHSMCDENCSESQ